MSRPDSLAVNWQGKLMGADFINIELEVRNSSDLSALAAAFGKKFSPNYCGQVSHGKYLLSGAFAGAGRPGGSPDAIASGLCKMIRELKPSARRIWNNASDRVFDVGLDVTTDRKAIVDLFSNRTVADIGKLGARIAVSVYAHDLKNKAKKSARPANKRSEWRRGRGRS